MSKTLLKKTPLKLNPKSERILIIGVSGSGKTHFIQHELLPQFRNKLVVVLDSMEEYSGKGYIITNRVYDIIKLSEKITNAKIIFRIDPNKTEDFLTVCRFMNLSSNSCLMIDEITLYKDSDNEYLSNISRRGRHFNQSLIIATQCPVDMPPPYRNNITNIYFFQTYEKRYLDFCKSIIGNQADKLVRLRLGEYIVYPDCVLYPNHT